MREELDTRMRGSTTGKASRELDITEHLERWNDENGDTLIDDVMSKIADTIKTNKKSDTNGIKSDLPGKKQGAQPAVGAAASGFDPISNASNKYGVILPGEKMSSVVDVPISIIGKSNEETQLRREMLRQMSELQVEYRKVLEDLEQELAFLRGFNMED